MMSTTPDVLSGIAVLPLIFLLAVLAVMGVLMPWFVFRIKRSAAKLEREAKRTNELLQAILARELPAKAVDIFEKKS